MRLCADVGGTNTRLALSRDGVVAPDSLRSYANADWASLYAVIAAYLVDQAQASPAQMVIAVAGPVHGDYALLTNRDWHIETAQLAASFGGAQAVLLNDLTALGYALPHLRPEQLRLVSPGSDKQSGLAQSLVVGIGTGFNVSPVLETGDVIVCPAVEAGHVAMPLSVAQALMQCGIEPGQYPTVEALFSGRGLTAFCRELTQDTALDGAAAIARYRAPDAEHITAVIDRYAALLGWLLQALSLSYLPSSGIYMAGTVARAIIATAPASCLEILRRPGAIKLSRTAALYTIEDDSAALSGCAAYSVT